MSACIYHDDEAVSICPSCDFGVCQQCMDQGSEGVCSTCSEERDMRRQHSALQREYNVEEQIPRCNYCRAAEDEETPLDEQGYCPTCATLARCCLHEDLIAVGHCKSCRKEYCRKCLGFTDICQSCTAKNKTRPAKPVPPPAAAAARPAKKKAASTQPMKDPVPKAKEAGAGGKKGTSAQAKPPERGEKPTKGAAKPEEKGKKKGSQAPSRGQQMIQAKLAAKSAPNRRIQVVGASIAGALVCILMLSGMLMRAQSPDDQSRVLQEQMVTVHKGIIHYYRKNNELPKDAAQIYASLKELKVRNVGAIHIARKPPASTKAPGAPNSVLYEPMGGTFIVTAADSTGKIITDPRGDMVFLDQTFDSSR